MTEEALGKAPGVRDQREILESWLMLGGLNAEVEQVDSGAGRSLSMANSAEFILKEPRENAFPHGLELSFFTHSVNSVTAAFGASWHHGKNQ